MGVEAEISPTKARVHSTVPARQETHFDSLHLRDHSTKHIIHNGKGFRIKKSQEEWLQCICSLLPETNPRIQRGLWHHACSLRHLVQLTLHRWSCFSQKKWPEAPMMTIPSLKLLIPSKSMAKSTQKCSDTPYALSETNLPPLKLTMPTLNL